MSLIAWTPSRNDLVTKMAGVVLASLSSGTGELSYLGMTHYFGSSILAAWESGTGAAGLVGAGLGFYSLMTTSWGLSSQKPLSAAAFLPLITLGSFFLILPKGPISSKPRWKISTTESVSEREGEDGRGPRNEEGDHLPILGGTDEVDSSVIGYDEDRPQSSLPSRLLTFTLHSLTQLNRRPSTSKPKASSLRALAIHNFTRSRSLLIP